MIWKMENIDGNRVMRTWDCDEIPEGIRCEMVDSRPTKPSCPAGCGVKAKVWDSKLCTEPYCNVFGNIPDATEWVDHIVNMLEVRK